MRISLWIKLLVLAIPLALQTNRCRAQIIVIDDVIFLSRSASEKEQVRTNQYLKAPGMESPLPSPPGADEPLLKEPVRIGPRLTTLRMPQRPGPRSETGGRRPGTAPQRPPGGRAPLPIGPLELPTGEDEGPADGLPLDRAIDLLVENNYDLRVRYQELPKAQTDILSAGLRNNPFLFLSVDSVPYGRYTPQRPGATVYDITIVQPIDISGRRRNRILVAQQAKRVLEAAYQESVRQEIDRLYTAYVDVLEARENARALRASAARASQLVESVRDLVRQEKRPEIEASRLLIQKFNAEAAVREAETALVQANRLVAALLAIPPEQADSLTVRDALRDRSPPPPGVEALVRLALMVRPDVAAYRLSVERAKAELKLEKSEGLEDVFLFYTPYTAQDFTPLGQQVAGGWGLGVLLPIPVFNRNQGNIQRARINVTQMRINLEGLEQQASNEVRQAFTEYTVSAQAVRQLEQEGLPLVDRIRVERLRGYSEGKENLNAYLESQKDYSEMVRRYLDALVRHRRAMLKINTAVGQRVLP
ncbi:MAG TPA: TolC family protein [Gemmataceae bacterium]|nr:TolC family protein [Gemmataceae bacterium]